MKRKQLNTIEGLKHLKDFYEIQEDGTLYGHRGRKLAETLNSHGYVQNKLSTEIGEKPFYRHRLVALAFIPNPENKREINHRDENKLNNDISNLEWATRAENINHGTRNERISKPVIGICVKTGQQIEFPSTMEAGRQGFHQGHVAACCRGEEKTHKGYEWRFKE